jgi:hypothetical protein
VEELASGDASLWPGGVTGSGEAGDRTGASAVSNGSSTVAESDALGIRESERGWWFVGAGGIGSTRGCILGGGDGLSCARDILVAKAEAGSRSMSFIEHINKMEE